MGRTGYSLPIEFQGENHVVDNYCGSLSAMAHRPVGKDWRRLDPPFVGRGTDSTNY